MSSSGGEMQGGRCTDVSSYWPLTLSDQGPTLTASFHFNHLVTGLSPITLTLRVKILTNEFGQGHSSVVGLPWARCPLSALPSFKSSVKRRGDG